RTHLWIVLSDLLSHTRQTVRPGPNRVSGLGLRIQKRTTVIDQPLRLIGYAVQVVGDAGRRVQQGLEIITGAVEGLERLVEQVADPVFRNAVDQLAELIQHRTDLLRNRRVVHCDYRAIPQIRTGVGARTQIDVLLTDGRNAENVGLQIRRDLRRRV